MVPGWGYSGDFLGGAPHYYRWRVYILSDDVYALIYDAIVNKRHVIATYHGLYREMCPHTLGTKRGRRQALFYQFAGESSKGLPPDGEWRCIILDQLENVSVREGEWHTSPDHSVPQTCVDVIDVEVQY